VYNFSRVFLLEEHPYRRETSTFNGKLERTQRPTIMTPKKWLREYEREKEREITKMFDSNGDPMFDDTKFFDTYVEKFPIGMKKKSIFYELPYWQHIKISHLLDLMHIFKNVSYSLWRNISLKESDTLVVRRDIISSKSKKKHSPRQESKGEVGPSWSFKEGDVPWILKKEDISLEKEVMLGVKVPYLYGSSLRHFFTLSQEHFLRLKSHDYLNLLKVRHTSKICFYYL
jgi:hypothetical protein